MRTKEEILADVAKNARNIVGVPELIEALIDLRDQAKELTEAMQTSNSLRLQGIH